MTRHRTYEFGAGKHARNRQEKTKMSSYLTQVDRFPAGVKKVLSTSCVGEGVVQIRRFSSLNVVEITFRPTFWTPSARTRGKTRENPGVAGFRKRSSRRLESMAIATEDSKNDLFLRRST